MLTCCSNVLDCLRFFSTSSAQLIGVWLIIIIIIIIINPYPANVENMVSSYKCQQMVYGV